MQEFMYKMLEDETYCVMSYKGDEPEVVIPSTYCSAPITILYDNLFSGHKEITSVTIPDTVTDIGEYCFEDTDSLKHIKLPESLTSLWPYAFAFSGLEEITLPDGLTTVPAGAFMGCRNLKTLNCGKNLKQIYSWALGGCFSLTEFNHDPSVKINPKTFMQNDISRRDSDEQYYRK